MTAITPVYEEDGTGTHVAWCPCQLCEIERQTMTEGKTLTRVLVVDQRFGLTPYALREQPIDFVVLVDAVAPRTDGWGLPKVLEVEDDYRPQFGTLVIRAGKDGHAEVWKSNVDSSG